LIRFQLSNCSAHGIMDEFSLFGSVDFDRFHKQSMFVAEGGIKAGWLDTERLAQFGNTNTVISPLPK